MDKMTNKLEVKQYSPFVGGNVVDKFLGEYFNFLNAKINVQDKIGPKFNSAF